MELACGAASGAPLSGSDACSAGAAAASVSPGNRIRGHEVAKWLPEKQAKQTRQVADLALWEPEVGFEPTTFRLRVGCSASI
jgi:hypothetical protein